MENTHLTAMQVFWQSFVCVDDPLHCLCVLTSVQDHCYTR